MALERIGELMMRFAPLRWIPVRLVLPSVPRLPELPGRTGRLDLEIVSHCWNYSHLLVYQLSSLVTHPSTRLDVTYTLFFSAEDQDTVALVEEFGSRAPPGLTWNFQPMQRSHLLRRAIGRNRAAKETTADWIWFTDCDVIFHAGALDALATQLQGCRARLVFPSIEHSTPLLPADDPVLAPAGTVRSATSGTDLDIDPEAFSIRNEMDRAKGSYQITHGDVARELGYCDALPMFQKPVDRWRKTYEDRAFRWLIGTEGTAIDVPGLYRVRHAAKGRYGDQELKTARLRGGIRRLRSWLREGRRRRTN
jgi:hypothetical protein